MFSICPIIKSIILFRLYPIIKKKNQKKPDFPSLGNIYVMCARFLKFHLFSFKFDIHPLQSDSNNVSICLIFFFSHVYAKVSDYRAVGLSSRRTIDTHPTLFNIKKIHLTHTVR